MTSKFIHCFLFSTLFLSMGIHAAPIETHFNHDAKHSYTEPYRKIQRIGENLEQIWIDQINKSQKRVDLAVYEFRLPLLAKALAAAKQRGVAVRVVLEADNARAWSQYSKSEIAAFNDYDSERYQEFLKLVDQNHDGRLSQSEVDDGDALVILDNAGIPRIDDSMGGRNKGVALMHHKFILVDDNITMVSSANFTTSDVHGDFASPLSRGNSNSLVVFDSAQLNAAFSEEFEILWSQHFGPHKTAREAKRIRVGSSWVTVEFSPSFGRSSDDFDKSVNGLIAKSVGEAQKSVDFALYVFSEQKIVDQMQSRQPDGVSFRGLVDPEFAWRNYSELLDMLGLTLLDANCKEEADNNPWKTPVTTVGTAHLPKGDKLHHKFGIIDGTKVAFGSHNWSAAANSNNDETFLLIDDAQTGAQFEQEFDQLYSNSILGAPQSLIEKIDAQDAKCGKRSHQGN